MYCIIIYFFIKKRSQSQLRNDKYIMIRFRYFGKLKHVVTKLQNILKSSSFVKMGGGGGGEGGGSQINDIESSAKFLCV